MSLKHTHTRVRTHTHAHTHSFLVCAGAFKRVVTFGRLPQTGMRRLLAGLGFGGGWSKDLSHGCPVHGAGIQWITEHLSFHFVVGVLSSQHASRSLPPWHCLRAMSLFFCFHFNTKNAPRLHVQHGKRMEKKQARMKLIKGTRKARVHCVYV